MKTIKIVALTLLLFTLSCSKSSTSDDEEFKTQENSIIGYWVLSDIVPLETGSEEGLADSQEFKKALKKINCYMLTMDFRADKSLALEVFDINVIEGSNPDDPDYDCFSDEKASGTWSFEDDTLTLTSSDDFTSATTVRFESSTVAYMSGEAFGEIGQLAKELIFQKFLEI